MFVVSHRLKCQPVLAVLGLNLIGAFSSKEKPRLTFESFPSQSRRLFRGATQSILNSYCGLECDVCRWDQGFCEAKQLLKPLNAL